MDCRRVSGLPRSGERGCTMRAAAHPGEAGKLEAHALLEEHRRGIIREARRRLLLHLLEHGEATADDARREMVIPPWIDPKALGAVPGKLARKGIIRRVGYRRTERAEGHARPVTVWALHSLAGARAWLANNPPVQQEKLNGQAELWD